MLLSNGKANGERQRKPETTYQKVRKEKKR